MFPTRLGSNWLDGSDLGLMLKLREVVLGKAGYRQFPVHARHSELSVLSSLDDSPGQPTKDLLDLAIRAARLAMDIDLSSLHDRSPDARTFLSVFPGEHYKLLASLVSCLRPVHVCEIGTFTGLSALAMLTSLDRDAHLTTYDIVPWEDIEGTALRRGDFAVGRLEQRIGDLANIEYFNENLDVLGKSTLIFIDGPKDGRFEPAFMRLLLSCPRDEVALLVLDDIRLWNMLGFWRDLELPKVDLTSFGHWSGTGICLLGPSNRG